MQTGTSGYYIGRDGIPTDIHFLEALVTSCGKLEALCRNMYPLIQCTSSFHVNMVMDYVLAAVKLHEDDVAGDAIIRIKNRTLPNADLYAAYQKTYLTTYMTASPYSSRHSGIKQPCNFEKMCMDLVDAASIFIQLAGKVNAYGYEQEKYILMSGTSIVFALHVDRAMRFFKILSQTSDVTYQHIPFVPLLPMPPGR